MNHKRFLLILIAGLRWDVNYYALLAVSGFLLLTGVPRTHPAEGA